MNKEVDAEKEIAEKPRRARRQRDFKQKTKATSGSENFQGQSRRESQSTRHESRGRRSSHKHGGVESAERDVAPFGLRSILLVERAVGGHFCQHPGEKKDVSFSAADKDAIIESQLQEMVAASWPAELLNFVREWLLLVVELCVELKGLPLSDGIKMQLMKTLEAMDKSSSCKAVDTEEASSATPKTKSRPTHFISLRVPVDHPIKSAIDAFHSIVPKKFRGAIYASSSSHISLHILVIDDKGKRKVRDAVEAEGGEGDNTQRPYQHALENLLREAVEEAMAASGRTRRAMLEDGSASANGGFMLRFPAFGLFGKNVVYLEPHAVPEAPNDLDLLHVLYNVLGTKLASVTLPSEGSAEEPAPVTLTVCQHHTKYTPHLTLLKKGGAGHFSHSGIDEWLKNNDRAEQPCEEDREMEDREEEEHTESNRREALKMLSLPVRFPTLEFCCMDEYHTPIAKVELPF